jgi:radical SAM superfamily enzyme YgiQ (UPF0313 family)
MVQAGFAAVFVGIETPSEEALRETRKVQNLGRDMIEQVRSLRRAGLDVWAGFIVGFDHDGPDIFDRMIAFVQEAGIAYAMVGMLMALPGTPLYARLHRERRLLPEAEPGDMFGWTNIATKLPRATLIEGYCRVLETLYEPASYFDRCREHLRHWRPPPSPLATGRQELQVAWRSLRRQGLAARYRSEYWRFLSWTLRHDPRKLGLAVAQACAGHHFIAYTRETVVPSLRDRLGRANEHVVSSLTARSASA